MQYLLMIYEDEDRFEKLPKAQVMAEVGEYRAVREQYGNSIVNANPLQPTNKATTVRIRDGKRLITDGPFAETKEQLGGYFLVEAANLDEAIEVAAKLPGARFGSVEVRPIMTFA